MKFRLWSIFIIGLFFTGCTISSDFSLDRLSTTQFKDQSGGVFEHPIVYANNNGIWISESDGENALQITPQDDKIYFAPAWFDDNQHIVYAAEIDDYAEIWLYDFQNQQADFIIGIHGRPKNIIVAPNHQYATYFIDDDLYVLNLTAKTVQRLHESAKDATWSPDAKQIVYTTSDKQLLSQDFTITGELRKPTVLLSQTLTAPVFINKDTIVYEAEWEGEYTLLALDLHSLTAHPLTGLRFKNQTEEVTLHLEPNGKRLLYIRPNEVTLLPDVWLIHIDLDAPKLLLSEVHEAIWSDQADVLYYVNSTINQEKKVVYTIFSATDNGLNKSEITQGHAVVSPVTIGSNESLF